MKKPIIKITSNFKDGRKTAKVLEKIVNHRAERYQGVIESIASIRRYLDIAYGLPSDSHLDFLLSDVMSEVVKMDIHDMEAGDTALKV